jgi:MarR family transcriptional regulator, lower aerobic nicotinate degradation pathway regulator
VGFLLRLAHQRATANLSQAIGGRGLTPAAFVTLARLGERGPRSQNELGRAVGMAPANIHATVRRLHAAGLVRVQGSPSDRRALLIDLSDAGRVLLEEVLPDADAANRRTLAPLGAAEQRMLIDLLRRLASAQEASAGA